MFFSVGVVVRFFPPSALQEALGQSSPPPKGVPQFILNMSEWPYIAGPRFIAALEQRGGLTLVDQALRHWPISTEQVIHPERYPGDVPTPLDIPQLAPKLGKGWRDLDVEEVGEEWLSAWLGLRLDPTQWRPATDGWDGGLYRAWSDGKRVAVVMRTAWDTTGDAGQFQRAVEGWIEPNEHAAAVRRASRRVDVLFATDRATLRRLQTLDPARG